MQRILENFRIFVTSVVGRVLPVLFLGLGLGLFFLSSPFLFLAFSGLFSRPCSIGTSAAADLLTLTDRRIAAMYSVELVLYRDRK